MSKEDNQSSIGTTQTFPIQTIPVSTPPETPACLTTRFCYHKARNTAQRVTFTNEKILETQQTLQK